jgi:4-hydroxy-3-polyprenylbenzoate decarboxylase
MDKSPHNVGRHFVSLRDFLDALRDLNDVREVRREVDTDLEIGAIIRRTHETYAPAPLFTNVRGHAGYRVVGAPLSYSSLPQARMARVALALGLAPETKPLEIIEALAWASKRTPIPPVVVKEGVCQQNVQLGEDVDLTMFPTPLIHAGDGGRYFNTLGFWVVRTPDGKWTNWSIARAMVLDGKRMTGVIAPYQHNGMIYKMWRERGEPMPYALVQGAEPAALFAGGMPVAYGVDEAGYLGGLFGEPLEVVRCKTVDLEVPAAAEIIVEGHVSIDETASEGPMGEYHGYLREEKYSFPIYHISAITYRDNPILPVTSAGKPIEEDHTVAGVSFSAVCLQQLRDEGLPVAAAWSVPEAAEHMLAVSVHRDWSQRTALSAHDLARRIATIAKGMHGGQRATRVLVCDEDIDLSDPRDLIWAWNSRCHPVEGHFALEFQPANPIEPMYAAAKLSFDGGRTPVGPIMVLNCLLPAEARDLHISDFANNFPKELQERVLSRWND